MKTNLSLLIVLLPFFTFAQQYEYYEKHNPYAKFGYKPKMATLSKGKYVEFFDADTIEIIGPAVFNTKTMEVIGFIQEDTVYGEYDLRPDVSSRWLSVDPLAIKYPEMTPYNFVSNTPIQAIDPDGRYTIFVSGYDWGDKNEGWKKYWGNGNYRKYAKRAQRALGDFSTIYNLDGSTTLDYGETRYFKGTGDSPNSKAKTRVAAGRVWAMNNLDIQEIKDAVNNGEQINLIGHSQGAAYSAGIAKYLQSHGIDIDNIVYLSPSGPSGIPEIKVRQNSYQVSAQGDVVVGLTDNSTIEGVDKRGDIRTNFTDRETWGPLKHYTNANIGVWDAVEDLQNMYWDYKPEQEEWSIFPYEKKGWSSTTISGPSLPSFGAIPARAPTEKYYTGNTKGTTFSNIDIEVK